MVFITSSDWWFQQPFKSSCQVWILIPNRDDKGHLPLPLGKKAPRLLTQLQGDATRKFMFAPLFLSSGGAVSCRLRSGAVGQELRKKQIDQSKWVGQKGYPKMSHVDLENDVTHDFGFPKFSDKPELVHDHEWPHKWDTEGVFLPPGFAHTGVDSVQQLEPIPISTKKNYINPILGLTKNHLIPILLDFGPLSSCVLAGSTVPPSSFLKVHPTCLLMKKPIFGTENPYRKLHAGSSQSSPLVSNHSLCTFDPWNDPGRSSTQKDESVCHVLMNSTPNFARGTIKKLVIISSSLEIGMPFYDPIKARLVPQTPKSQALLQKSP